MKQKVTISIVLLSIAFFTTTALSQSLFKEDVNYTTGDSLTSHAWLVSSGGTTNALLSLSPGLTFAGYASSGIGNATKLDTTGQDLYKSFPADSIGSVYLAFMFNVTKAATGDYFIGLSPSIAQTNYFARTFIKSSGSGFVMGISKSNETAVYGTTVFSLNTTYMAVVKYRFVASDSDFINVYVIPSGTGIGSEPASAELSYQDKTKNDATNLGFVTLRQGSAASAPRLFIDGVRIGRTWNDIFYSSLVTKTNINFGTVNLGSAPKDSFYVKNTGSVAVTDSIKSSNSVFTVSLKTGSIASADSQKIVVTYIPTSAVVSTGTILITPLGSTAPDTVSVSGSCLQSSFTVAPKSLDFGNVFKDSTKTDTTVTVTNASTTATLVIDSVRVRSTSTFFTVTPTSATIGIASTAKFTISFKPTAKGAVTGNVVFYHNALSKQDTVKISGNGVIKEPLFSVTPTSLDYHGVLVGQTKKDSVTVKNVGFDSLIISGVNSTDGAFNVTPLTARLGISATQKFYVTYSPTATGLKTASLIFTSNVSEVTDTVKASGSGLAGVTIAEARKDDNKDYIADHSVTKDTLVLYGVITTPNMGASASQTSYFMQDATGGIDVFFFGLTTTTYAIGDSVRVIGIVAQFKGLVEFTLTALDDAHFTILKHNAVVPAPKRMSLHQLVVNAEAYEGQMIELDTLYKATGTWPTVFPISNLSIFLTNASKTDTLQMFLDLDAALSIAEPAYPINVVGFVSQFSSVTPPNNGYEICPRFAGDISHTLNMGVSDPSAGIPAVFNLLQNYPNPFNPTTTLVFTVKTKGHASLGVYNILGQLVATLFDGNASAGQEYVNTFDASKLTSGVYFARLESGGMTKVQKLLLMK